MQRPLPRVRVPAVTYDISEDKEMSVLRTFTKATDAALHDVREEMRIRKTKEVFLLFALGSQFDHLIKQELERLGVFCLVADPSKVKAKDVSTLKPVGIILSGGPSSVHTEPPPFDEAIFDLGIPLLGICLGFQMWAKHIGETVVPARKREFSTHALSRIAESPLFEDLPGSFQVLQSHGDRIASSECLQVDAETVNAPIAAGSYKHLFGVQFHPETTHTDYGLQIFENFCFIICKAKDRYPAGDVAKRKIEELKEVIGERKVLLALSGGADSSTVAYLLKEATKGKGKVIRGVYIRGIDRPDDEAHVIKHFGNQDWIELKIVDATEAFLALLPDVSIMDGKRMLMQQEYLRILEHEAKDFGASFIAQGTLYTDISESGGGYESGAKKAKIKRHHNVGLEFSLPELTPLADCVKDSGRNIGRLVGVPEELLLRHPFPGVGILVRIEGEITKEKLALARAADEIFISELRAWGLYTSVWQAGAVVTASLVPCTKGDDASQGYVIALWAVWSVNGFTAEWAELPNDFLRHVSKRITNELESAGAVTYRISDKPPTTIEWG